MNNTHKLINFFPWLAWFLLSGWLQVFQVYTLIHSCAAVAAVNEKKKLYNILCHLGHSICCCLLTTIFCEYEPLVAKAKHLHQINSEDQDVFWLFWGVYGVRSCWTYCGGLGTTLLAKWSYSEITKHWKQSAIMMAMAEKRCRLDITRITPTYKEPHAGKMCLLG